MKKEKVNAMIKRYVYTNIFKKHEVDNLIIIKVFLLENILNIVLFFSKDKKHLYNYSEYIYILNNYPHKFNTLSNRLQAKIIVFAKLTDTASAHGP